MRFRLNLQWTTLLPVAGGMSGTLLLSAYLHRVITGSLVEEDRYTWRSVKSWASPNALWRSSC
jgi:hypothetical protein